MVEDRVSEHGGEASGTQGKYTYNFGPCWNSARDSRLLQSFHEACADHVDLQKVTETDVLKAANSDSRSALLVYANDKAISWESMDLPSPLYVHLC